jgi:hypothetical protein
MWEGEMKMIPDIPIWILAKQEMLGSWDGLVI